MTAQCRWVIEIRGGIHDDGNRPVILAVTHNFGPSRRGGPRRRRCCCEEFARDLMYQRVKLRESPFVGGVVLEIPEALLTNFDKMRVNVV